VNWIDPGSEHGCAIPPSDLPPVLLLVELLVLVVVDVDVDVVVVLDVEALPPVPPVLPPLLFEHAAK
jgi:hypothetical protein